jgi:uncharacterized membrane protein
MSGPYSTTGTIPDRVPRLPPGARVWMTWILRGGLFASIFVLGGGLIAYLLLHPSQSYETVVSSNPILGYLSFGGLASGLASGAVPAYLTLGLLILVATPLLRVASGFYYFERGKERTMAAITFLVLAMLLIGILVIGPLVR